MSFESNLNKLGLVLPGAPSAAGLYEHAVLIGNQLFLSGGLPFDAQGDLIKGSVPSNCSVEAAQKAAELIILNRLAVAKEQLGCLSKIKQVIQLQGLVNSDSDFYGHPGVIDSASQLLIDILGDAGKHSRLAYGVAALPLNAAVEIALTLEVEL